MKQHFKNTDFDSENNKNNSVCIKNDDKETDDYKLIDKPGKIYKRSYEIRMAIGKAHCKKKKNYQCWLKNKKGSLHPSFKHGQGKIRFYDSEKYNAWMQGVYKNNNFKCFISGATENLCCHHLNSWSSYPENRYDIKNGVLILKKFHLQFHKIYGNNVSAHHFEHYLKTYHNWEKKIFPWSQGNHEPSVSVEETQEKILVFHEKKFLEFKTMCEANNHQILEGDYINASSLVNVQCNIHNQIFITRFTNYKKCKYGLPCCGKAVQINKSKNYLRNKDGTFSSQI
uniref:Putative HNH homing endonuclease n=1 Tax=Lobochlamys segnis TaxID=52035 RepID=A0A0S2ICX9_9CHLO|nr:putative HNH homing endonuclease [Lobochlamys segnis]